MPTSPRSTSEDDLGDFDDVGSEAADVDEVSFNTTDADEVGFSEVDIFGVGLNTNVGWVGGRAGCEITMNG